jgi:hypothetical protein
MNQGNEGQTLKTTGQRRGTVPLTMLFGVTMVLSGTTAFGSIDLGTFNAAPQLSPNGTGATVAASAHFVETSSGVLQITLANTYSGDTKSISDVLYGVFFSSGATLASLASGDAAAGSVIWTYPNMKTPATHGAALGVNTALTDPWQLVTMPPGTDGLSGMDKEGLVSKGFTGSVSDGLGNAQHQPYDASTAILTVDYTGTISAIGQVKFLYGTAAPSSGDEISGNIVAAPEPAAWAWLAAAFALVPLGAGMLRSRNKPAV